MSHKILIAAGGTGGHIFPAIAIAEQFRKSDKNNRILFVSQHKEALEKKVFERYQYESKRIKVSGLFGKSFWEQIKGIVYFFYGSIQSLIILLSYRPQIIIGVGAYFSGPILLMAYLLGKKIFIQEQNAHPGITNKMLGKIAHCSFIPYQQSKHLFKNPIVVGNPIRKEIEALYQIKKKQDHRLKILILGGSQGAKQINKRVFETIQQYDVLKVEMEIHHQIGKNEIDLYQERYKDINNIKIHCYDFIDDIAELYQDCNLIISRSGSIIYEFIAAQMASILIPITNSSGNHQLENARTMQNHDAAFLIEENELDSKSLKYFIDKFIDCKNLASDMGNNAQKLYQGHAAEQIVEHIHKNIQ